MSVHFHGVFRDTVTPVVADLAVGSSGGDLTFDAATPVVDTVTPQSVGTPNTSADQDADVSESESAATTGDGLGDEPTNDGSADAMTSEQSGGEPTNDESESTEQPSERSGSEPTSGESESMEQPSEQSGDERTNDESGVAEQPSEQSGDETTSDESESTEQPSEQSGGGTTSDESESTEQPSEQSGGTRPTDSMTEATAADGEPDETAIWFDLDGTLLAIDDYGSIIEQACEAVGIEGEARTTFVETYDTEFFTALRELREDPYHHAAREGIAAAAVDAEPSAFVSELLDAECTASRVPDAVRETLDALDEHRLGVLTNGVDEWQRTKLEHHDLTERFDAVLVSEEVGAHKPDRRVFELAGGRLNAADRWMVGDDREADIDGARAAGWNAVHVSGPDELPKVLDRLAE